MRALAIAALLAAALLVGCGGSSPSPEDTVSAAISGLSDGNSKKVCAQLSPEGERKLLVVLRDNPLNLIVNASTCEEAIVKLHAKLSKAIRAALKDGEVDDAKVKGDTAVVHVPGFGMDVELKKIADKWKITGGLLN
ncbi:MAG: hypothetical protein QOG42_189 [Solirubrobacteraceae bacterium]|jgi:hypothetical protein|nr:hypothetical protein [Solirubrobacteraceae bacterium]